MNLKIILDEDMHFGMASALRKRGYNVIHVQELDRKGLSDEEQLNYAVQNESCIITFNIKDFVILHNEYVRKKRKHFGIIVTKQRSFKETLHRLLPRLQQCSKDTMKNRLEFV